MITRCQNAQMHRLPTLRYDVAAAWQHFRAQSTTAGKRCIWAFWHRVIIPIVVVASKSRHGGDEHHGV